MTLADRIVDRFGSTLGRVLGRVRGLTRSLSPKHDWVESIRGSCLRLGHPFLSSLGRPTVRRKGVADYVCTVDISADELERVLYPRYRRNLLATKKYRIEDGTREWTVGSWVHTESYDEPVQHHIYMFPTPDGGVDIYGHREADVTDPDGHHHGRQIHGDPDSVLRTRLDEGGIDYYRRDTSR